MAKRFLLLGSILMALSVAIGAFGAHGLEPIISERMLKNYQTGVQYHMIHAIGVLVVALVSLKLPQSSLVHKAGWSFLIGILFFSGSLYLMALTGMTMLGAITPIGGIAFIIGWILLGVAAVKEL